MATASKMQTSTQHTSQVASVQLLQHQVKTGTATMAEEGDADSADMAPVAADPDDQIHEQLRR